MNKATTILLLVLVGWFASLQPARAGYTSFPAGSVIVPMDPCWQPNNDTALNSAFRPTGCDASLSDRGIFQAYGMIYEMLRNGANVAWVVNPAKTDENDADMTIAGALDAATGQIGAPVTKYIRGGTATDVDPPARTITWTPADGSADHAESFDQHVIDYRGGPFIIHKKFLNDTMWAIIDKFSNVKVHVAQVPFTAPIDKVLDKLPPKLAILGGKNTAILRDYLLAAGLGAAESLVFEEVTPKQIIEDYLITPDADGNTFSLFWAPHWVVDEEVGALTLSDGTNLTAGQAQLAVLTKLREFIEEGNSAFLECASIESLEGSENGPTSLNTRWNIWNPSIQSVGGWVTANLPANWTTSTPAGADDPGARLWTNNGSDNADYVVSDMPTSFLTQCAGWDYHPTSGHVHNFKPHDNVRGLYNDDVERFVHDRDGAYNGYDPGFDYYVGGRINGSPTQGYVSYLAGHRYLQCSSSGTETTSTPTTVGPQNQIAFTLEVPASLSASETISVAVYYDGGTAPVVARFQADGSGGLSGDDAILSVDVQNLAVTVSGSTRSFANLVVSNMSTASHTIDSINVTWTGCASVSSSGGSGEYVIKRESVTRAKFCDGNNTPEGETCPPDRTVQLTKSGGMQYSFEVLQEIADNDWFFVDFNYLTPSGTAGTAHLGLQLDRTGASGNRRNLQLSRAQILPECSSGGGAEVNFDLNQLQVDVNYYDNNRTRFKKMVINNVRLSAPGTSSEPTITGVTATWGSKDSLACSKPATTGTCSEALSLASDAPTFSVSGSKGNDLTANLDLEPLNDGGSGTGAPPPDLIDVSYCDPSWRKTNTCGSRFVLNTVLGLQFTVISNTYVQSSPIIDRGTTYQGSYEFPTYRGHLQAIDLVPDSLVSSSILWDAGSPSVMPPAGTTGNPATITSNPTSRYIFTNNVKERVEFETASVTQTSDFLHQQLGKATLDETKVLINTVRGRNKVTAANLDGLGEQPYRLWGVRTSTPAVVGGSALARVPARDRIVYVGADDGMLHAFYAGSGSGQSYTDGNGKEIWAYIPSALLPFLKNQSYVDPTKDPKVSVSGSPSVRDFLFPIRDDSGAVTGTEYRTLLLCTATIAEQNRGLVFALDVTNPYAPRVLWETDLSGYNVGDAAGVSLGKVRNGDSIRNWAFITANYHERLDADGNPDPGGGAYGINALALDVWTGEVQWQWQQNYLINANVSATPAIPSLLDFDDNGVVDYMVFGDMDGRLWQLNAPSGSSVLSTTAGDQPVFAITDADGNLLGVPIGASVALYHNQAIFGTGGTDFADDSLQYGLYDVALGERQASLLWKAEGKASDGVTDFLQTGEKIWGAPMIDSKGRIYIATGKGYQQQGTDMASSLDPTSASTGRVHVLDKTGKVLTSLATESASVGSLALADGGAVATDFSGNMIRLDHPRTSGLNQDVRVKVFTWRKR